MKELRFHQKCSSDNLAVNYFFISLFINKACYCILSKFFYFSLVHIDKLLLNQLDNRWVWQCIFLRALDYFLGEIRQSWINQKFSKVVKTLLETNDRLIFQFLENKVLSIKFGFIFQLSVITWASLLLLFVYFMEWSCGFHINLKSLKLIWIL